MFRFVNNIVRTIQWLPVIWKDVDWDWNGLLNIIAYKVKRMKDLQNNSRTGAHWSYRVREMDEFRHLVELVKDDPDDEWSLHYYEWDVYKEIDEKCKDEKAHKLALDLSYKRDERNWHNMWHYLEKNLRTWWD